MSTEAPPVAPASPAKRTGQRRTWFIRLAVVVVIVAVAWTAYVQLFSSKRVVTEDAYVQAPITVVTALVSGTLIETPMHETFPVKKGDVVAVIDPADFRIALEQAQAELGQTERRVQQYSANEVALAAQRQVRVSDIAAAESRLTSAQADFSRADQEYGRRSRLSGTGAVSVDEVADAENRRLTTQAAVRTAEAALVQARASVTAAEEQRRAAAVLSSGSVGDNPEVLAARAKVERAQLDLDRTIVRAPVDGLISKHAISVGQRVQPGAQMMTIAPVQLAYVDANFKEVQLRKIHIGSTVTLTSDLYGEKVEYHGTVVGIAGGSGSSQSLIPAQNATGNWIKVVQRVPVRIALDEKDLAEHPLRIGLSMKAVVDVQ